MFVLAARYFNIEAMKAVFAAGADPCAVNMEGNCALTLAGMCAAKVTEESVRAKTDAVIELCAQTQLGMSYAEHCATLVVGASVTWTNNYFQRSLGGNEGTIVETDPDGPGTAYPREAPFFTVEGALSGKTDIITASRLRLKA